MREEEPPTLGVREPRRPKPKRPSTGAQAEPEVELPPALETAGTCMIAESQ